MEYGGASLDPEVREGLARTYKPLRLIGIVAIVIGCFAILLPELFSLGAAVFVGVVLVIASAFLTAAAFTAHGVGSLLARLAWALLTFLVGLWLIIEPHNGTLTLTLVLGIYFLLMGLTRIARRLHGARDAERGLGRPQRRLRPDHRHPGAGRSSPPAPIGRSACWSGST